MQYEQRHHIEVTAQAAGAVIYDQSHRFLLVQEREGSKAGLWHIPSGRLESGEFPEAAAYREVTEETGLSVIFESYLKTYVGQFDDGGLVLRHAWIAPYPELQSLKPQLTDEIQQARFFTIDDIQKLYNSGKLRMYHTWLMLQDAQHWLDNKDR